MTLINMISNRK